MPRRAKKNAYDAVILQMIKKGITPDQLIKVNNKPYLDALMMYMRDNIKDWRVLDSNVFILPYFEEAIDVVGYLARAGQIPIMDYVKGRWEFNADQIKRATPWIGSI